MRYCPFVTIDKKSIDRLAKKIGLDGLGFYVLLIRFLGVGGGAIPADLPQRARCTEKKIMTLFNRLKKAGLVEEEADGTLTVMDEETSALNVLD